MLEQTIRTGDLVLWYGFIFYSERSDKREKSGS